MLRIHFTASLPAARGDHEGGAPRHDVLSVGDESEDFSMLDAPRPSTQARMRAAVNDGTLAQLVLDGTFGLGSVRALRAMYNAPWAFDLLRTGMRSACGNYYCASHR